MQAFCQSRLLIVVASENKIGHGDQAEPDGRKAYSCRGRLVPLQASRCSVQRSQGDSSPESKISKVTKITKKRTVQKENASFVDGKRGHSHRKTVRDYVDEVVAISQLYDNVHALISDSWRQAMALMSHSFKMMVLEGESKVPLFLTNDGGPPRWFSPLIPAPPERAPLMLFLPGLDGTGWGLLLHHESLGRFFELRCLHIPVHDRTSYIGLVKLVEEIVLEETKLHPSAPIYLVGDSVGSALALSVAARNPKLDLILILANPATSFPNSRLQPLLPMLGSLTSDAFTAFPHILNFTLGGVLSLPQAKGGDSDSWLLEQAEHLWTSLIALLPTPPNKAEVLRRDTFLWKLKMLQISALDANARLHNVKAEVLILASGKDHMLPSSDEANRLRKIIPGCRARYFKNSDHTLFLDGSFDLATVVRAAGSYRRSHQYEPVHDYVQLTNQEFEHYYDNNLKWNRQLYSPVYFSTSENGAVVQGLSNIPTDRPVLLVGNHMFLGLELGCLVTEFFTQKKLLLRGLAHPVVLGKYEGDGQPDASTGDGARLFGAVPASGKYLFQLMEHGHSALLYPGGVREALHRKEEAYKLFWPEKSEFVRMAVRHGVTIIPFGAIGEDDTFNILLDLDDLRKLPFLQNMLTVKGIPQMRENAVGEIADQPLTLPIVVPKGIGRMYFQFQKPIVTAGQEEEFRDKKKMDALYLHVKREVEDALQYLQKKRPEDPYRDLLPRLLYESSWGPHCQAPTFKP